jgi:AraC-like DNA-binding protein
MKVVENVQAFYNRLPSLNYSGKIQNSPGFGHFNVFERDECSVNTPYRRRDFYKISFIIGMGKLHYANKWIYIDKPALLFSNPLIPYSWEAESKDQSGWFCIFTEAFILPQDRNGVLQESCLFRVGGNPVYFMNKLQQADIADMYRKMMRELHADYKYKYEVLRNYLHLVIHEAMKMEPGDNFQKYKNASSRICTLFLELLERQFPIDSPQMHLKLKTATDYARHLSVHVNHLNRSVKNITGKTTTQHIAERIVQEAGVLLQHTDWTISEIAYSLGFEYLPYFTNFFRKITGEAPSKLRTSIV